MQAIRPSFLSGSRHQLLVFPALLTLLAAGSLRAQVMEIRSATATSTGPTLNDVKLMQAQFETFRRANLPMMNLGRGGGSGKCDEVIGRFCYWYDDKEDAPPDEPEIIKDRRRTLISALDSSYSNTRAERWTSGTLVRYLVEAGKNEEAIAAARKCETAGWWCPALRGFAYHAARRYAAADSAWTQALAAMDARDRCNWRDLKLMLDDGLLRDYRNVDCAERELQEARIWWLARPMMSSPGSDARSEFLARRLYTNFLLDAPSVHSLGFDADEQELLLRYGWPRAWTRGGFMPGTRERSITGHEPVPAPPMLPTSSTYRNPALSDSVGWRGKGLPGVRARYSPEYARRLIPLVHQSAIFRRGDSALVVMAYDVGNTPALASAAGSDKLSAALVLTRGEPDDAAISRLEAPGTRGTITARTLWAPMLMSAEVGNAGASTLARARYGMRATDLPGSRVSISDLLLFEAYDGMPRVLDDVLPHAMPSHTVKAGGKVGIYWETYNTSPLGEGIQVGITVAPEDKEGNWLRRRLTSLKLVRESQPVSVGLSDVSSRGRGFTPRAVVVDLATLKPGRYIMQLEIVAEGTAPVRAERVLTVR